MSVALSWNRNGYVEVVLSGKLTTEDYEQFGPALDEQFASQETLRMLVLLQNFDGWSLGGLWEDLKFDARHYDDVERLAIVGEQRWHEGMATFCRPFTSADIRYFDEADVEAARLWVARTGAPGKRAAVEPVSHRR
ncbi:hypothetical protein Mal4_09120 [Maioricimonas rarisocia]|uniref:STAS/SEC14 domain-containing protein n=1 Tax=Maioricimonas rarisocia TaxID=2528026 RepID=A0A517Z2D0_9PLAN|nr:STAS/SEC14 domain-containing protein [Maioricimonas rarisocia]QDU36625.1 hypothetical protein Mal4_09120 [Maioricimonas rarisocia]